MAEYRELPMVLASLRRSLVALDGRAKLLRIPDKFKLNTGHVSFFYNKKKFLYKRWRDLIKELKARGYAIDNSARLVDWSVYDTVPQINWSPDNYDKLLSFERIIVRLSMKPDWYRYRKKPVDHQVYINKVLKALT